MQHIADQAHVVVHRQPADHHGVLVGAKGAVQGFLVGQQIAVGDHHPLGIGGRAGGVLQEGDGRWIDHRRGQLVSPVLVDEGLLEDRGVDRPPGDLGELGDRPPRLLQALLQLRRRQDQGRPRVTGHGVQSPGRAGAARRRRGDGDPSGKQTGEEGDHQLPTRRQDEQHRAVVVRAAGSEDGGESAGAAVEISPAQPLAHLLAVGQKGEDLPCRIPAHMTLNDLEEARPAAAPRGGSRRKLRHIPPSPEQTHFDLKPASPGSESCCSDSRRAYRKTRGVASPAIDWPTPLNAASERSSRGPQTSRPRPPTDRDRPPGRIANDRSAGR